MTKSIAAIVKQKYAESGLEKEEFAKLIGISLPQLYLMLRGELEPIAACRRGDSETTRRRRMGIIGGRTASEQQIIGGGVCFGLSWTVAGVVVRMSSKLSIRTDVYSRVSRFRLSLSSLDAIRERFCND